MADTKIPLSIITPCYNEEDIVPHLAKTLQHFSENAGAIFDLVYIFIDDGSRDETWRLLNQYFPPSDKNILLQHTVNQGIAGAIVTGFAAVETEYAAVIDSDCTFHPDQLGDMFKLMKNDVDVVTSSPLHASGVMNDVPKWRQLMSYGAAFMYQVVLRQNLTSYTSCFRIFRSAVIKDMRLSNYGFCGVTEILVRLDMSGAKFVEFPAVLGTREFGESKINTVRTIFDHLIMVGKVILAKGVHVPLKNLALPRLNND